MGFRFKYYFLSWVLLLSCSRDLSQEDDLGRMYYRTKNDFSFMNNYTELKTYSSYFNFKDIQFKFSHMEMASRPVYIFTSVNFEKNDTFRLYMNQELPAHFNALQVNTDWDCKLNSLPGKKIAIGSYTSNKNQFMCRREKEVLEMFLSYSSAFTSNGNQIPYDFSCRLIIK